MHFVGFFLSDLERNEATDVWPLMDEHLNRLNACSQHLIDFVLPDVTLISELLSAEVITSRHKQYIDVGGTSNERNSRILEILARRSVADLKNYLQCLVKTRQGHLVPFLTRNTGNAVIHNFGNFYLRL